MTNIPKEKLIRKLTAALSDGKMVKETLYEVAAMFAMLKDPNVPALVKAKVAGALLYLLNPLDLLPDLLAIGLVDDIALLGITWNHVKSHITDEHRAKAKKFVLNILGDLNLTREIAP